MDMELDVPLGDADEVVGEAWADAWDVAEDLQVSEWAALHRKLTGQASNERGDWDNARHPMLVEIMDRMSEHDPAERIVIRKPTQWGGSEVLFNALGYWMCHPEPSPILLVVPGLDMARKHSKQRIGPSIKASEEWSKCVPPPRSRDGSNTDFEKEFRGEGIFLIATANSSTGLRAMPIRILIGDEVSKWPRDLDGEGSALEQAEGRTSSYQGTRKILLISSPTIVGACTISDEIEQTDYREYHVPCPLCRHMHVLDFDNLLPDGTLLCPKCGGTFGEQHKTWMLAPENGARWIPKYPERSNGLVYGYQANALYVPYRLGDSWAVLGAQQEKATKNPERLVAFTQMKKALPFAGERERADEQMMRERAEPGLMTLVVPNGYYLVTIGVDCQIDRFAVQVIAWGPDERGVVLMYEEIPGDPSSQDGYAELDAYLLQLYAKPSGVKLAAECVAIDGGNWTEEVAKFVRSRQQRWIATGNGHVKQNVIVVRGRSSGTGRVVNRPRKAETNAKGKTIARSVGVWGIDTDVAKNILFARIASDARAERIEDRHLRFPGGRRVQVGDVEQVQGALTDDYYHQLTAEYYDRAVRKWIHDKRIRNEAIDSLVYAYVAALCPHVRLDLIKPHEWEARARAQEPAMGDLFAQHQAEDFDPLAAATLAAASVGEEPPPASRETSSPGDTPVPAIAPLPNGAADAPTSNLRGTVVASPAPRASRGTRHPGL